MISSTLFVLAVLSCPFSAVASDSDDPYSTRLVQSLLRQPSGVSTSFLEKQVHRLGDRVSIALIKIYTQTDLSKPEIVKRYLPLIRESFSHSEFISLPEDKEPMVTTLLLVHVRDEVHDRELRDQISGLLASLGSKPRPKSKS